MNFGDFNASWFTTVPGLLITGGVVLLLFALILLVATGKKSKKEKKAKKEAELLNQQPYNNMAFPGQQVAPDMNAVQVQPVMTNDPNMNPGMTPVVNTGATMTPMGMNDPSMVSAMPMPPVVDSTGGAAVSVPVDGMYSAAANVQAVPGGMPPMQGMAPLPDMAAVQQVPQQQMPAQPAIYGGNSPAVNAAAPMQPQAYADPMAGAVPQGAPAAPGVQPMAPIAPVTPVAQPPQQ